MFLYGLSAMNRLLKNAHLLRPPHPSSLQRTFKYASLLRISGALHLGIFDQPEKMNFSTGNEELPLLAYSISGEKNGADYELQYLSKSRGLRLAVIRKIC